MSDPTVVSLPARGSVAPGFERVARCFADHLAEPNVSGASFHAILDGEPVVHLWGGLADRDTGTPWREETRVVVFSVTKALTSIAFQILAERGAFGWDDRVADHWPGFGTAGKEAVTVEQLLTHRGGLPFLDRRITVRDCLAPERTDVVLEALEQQEPAWRPGTSQGYHAMTWGLYAGELFRRLSDVPLGRFLVDEVFDPVESDARLGTTDAFDDDFATLYPPSPRERLRGMSRMLFTQPNSIEARVVRDVVRPGSFARRAFAVPAGPTEVYNQIEVRRGCLPWASATSTARGLARAMLPFAEPDRWKIVSPDTVRVLEKRTGWSRRDAVLQKPIGWTRGFMKEEPHLFSPSPESFGHSGMGGALVWCDPSRRLTFGYVPNAMDWRVRSPRAIALCRALYASLD